MWIYGTRPRTIKSSIDSTKTLHQQLQHYPIYLEYFAVVLKTLPHTESTVAHASDLFSHQSRGGFGAVVLTPQEPRNGKKEEKVLRSAVKITLRKSSFSILPQSYQESTLNQGGVQLLEKIQHLTSRNGSRNNLSIIPVLVSSGSYLLSLPSTNRYRFPHHCHKPFGNTI